MTWYSQLVAAFQKIDQPKQGRLINAAMAVAQKSRYLEVIESRWLASADLLNPALAGMRAAIANQAAPENPVQAAFRELTIASDCLQLDVESFYVFAKVLLDQVAHLTERRFGQGRKCSLDTHHKLVDNFETYCAAKALIGYEKLAASAKELKTTVSDHRDLAVVHPSGVHGRGILGTEHPIPSTMAMFKDGYRVSEPLTELRQRIVGHLDLFAEFVCTNS